MSETNHAETISSLTLEAIAANNKPFLIDGPSDRKFIARPGIEEAWDVKEIEPLLNERTPIPPKIVKQRVQLQQTESLIAYVNRFKNSDSVLFADIATSTILAIIDYHKKPADDSNADPVGTFGDHTANLILPKSLEWATWLGIDGKLMSHVDFANFLEENAADIQPLGTMLDGAGNVIEDAPSSMLELVRELQVKSSYGASSAIRNGDYVSIEMQKGDDISTKRNVALPNQIHLAIPVYFGEAPVLVDALIRRRAHEGSLSLGVKLVRPEAVRQDEFKRIVREIEADVMLATHYGKPA